VMRGNSAGVRPLAEVEVSPRLHDEKTDRNGLRRDSFGVTVRAGAEIAAGALWSGTAGLQYDFRNFADGELADFSGPGAFAELVWRPSRLTTVSLFAESGFEESAITGVSGNRTQDAEITLAHALKENLTLKVSGAAEYSAAQGSGSRSLTVEAGGEVEYAINRVLSLIASYEYTRYLSLGDGGDYEETEVTAGVKISR
jgi:hypothetical protein